MNSILVSILASTVQVTVPDAGSTGFLLGLGVLGLGLIARLVKNRRR